MCGGGISLQNCRQWVQGLLADKAAFWEPKLWNYSQGCLCQGLKARLNTRTSLGGGYKILVKRTFSVGSCVRRPAQRLSFS